jgi:hypothetical protein
VKGYWRDHWPFNLRCLGAVMCLVLSGVSL